MRLFVDNLTNVDFSYLCPERGLVGETWLAHLELDGSLDEQGMICDFGVVKKRLREWLDRHIDHCLLVPSMSAATNLVDDITTTTATLRLSDGEKICIEAPSQAITPVPAESITAETVSRWCETQLKDIFGATVASIQLSFSTEAIETPYYHYSHGLKKHSGQCQRIAHGHRSKLLVWRNEALCESSILEWTKNWQDIYIGTKEDCIQDDGVTLMFAYTALQGPFKIRIPKRRCYLVDKDTTVEQLAQHLADTISLQHPGDRVRVKAFEGIGKGAIAEAKFNGAGG